METINLDIKLTKPKIRYILMYESHEIGYARTKFNQKMCWKLKSAAQEFIDIHRFFIGGKELDKSKIKIKELA